MSYRLVIMMKAFFTTLCIMSVLCSFAQTEQIETDRPGESLTPFTTNHKWFQFESGIVKQTDKLDDGRSKEIFFTHPELALKYGLVKNLELRLLTNYRSTKFITPFQNNSSKGIPNFQAGAKYNIIKGKGVKPFVSFVAHYDFGSLRTIRKDSIDGANFRFLMLNVISDKFSLVYNVGMEWERFGSPHAYIYTLSPQIKFSEKWNSFIEVYGFIMDDRGPEHFIDGGLSFLVTNNLSVDASAGLRISKGESVKFFGVGVSYRFNGGK